MSQGLPRKLRYAFILQMVLAGASVIVGALVAGSIVKDVLTDQQLRSEAGQFWSGRARDADYPLPRSSTMHGYFTTGQQPAAGVPDELRRFGVGISELPGGNRTLIIEDRPQGRLYLVLSFYILDTVLRPAELVALLLELIAIYLATRLNYRASQ